MPTSASTNRRRVVGYLTEKEYEVFEAAKVRTDPGTSMSDYVRQVLTASAAPTRTASSTPPEK